MDKDTMKDYFAGLSADRQMQSFAWAIARYCEHKLCRDCVFDSPTNECRLTGLPSNWKVDNTD